MTKCSLGPSIKQQERAHARLMRRAKHPIAREAPTLVILRWLNTCFAGQWTPFEAATAIKAELEKAGYKIVPDEDFGKPPRPPQRSLQTGN